MENRFVMRRLHANVAAALAVAVLMASTQAHAALDAAVGTGITAAKTDLVALYGLLTAAGIACFVAAVVYRKFKLR